MRSVVGCSAPGFDLIQLVSLGDAIRVDGGQFDGLRDVGCLWGILRLLDER